MPILPVERSYYNPVIERMSREEILGLQWARLKLLLECVYYTNPFYRKRFQEAKLTPDKIKTMEDFRKLPLMSKADLIPDLNAVPPYGTILGVPENKLVRFAMTSGTSGKGQEVIGFTQADAELQTVWARGFHWSGVRRGDVLVNCFATSFGPSNAGLSSTQTFLRMGVNLLHLGLSYSTEDKARMLLRFNPHYIWLGGHRLITVCRQLGIEPRRDFPRLKSVGGGLTYEEAVETQEFYNARVSGFYGLTEAKTVAAHTCEHGVLVNGKPGMYHIFEDQFLIEILDRNTREPVAFGEEGEIVVTALPVEASPLLRFAMSDRTVYLPPNYCDCGRPFAGLQACSIGRYDDMLKIRGMNVWPSAVDGALFSHPEVEEYQSRVWVSAEGYEEILVSVELRKDIPEARRRELLPQLAEELKDRTGIRMTVGESKEPLPKWEGTAKPRRWKDERRKG